MSIIRFRPPSTRVSREALLRVADTMLKKLAYSDAFRTTVRERLSLLLADLQIGGYVDYSSWAEFTALDPDTVAAIEPFIERLVVAVADEALQSFALQFLPEVILHLEARALLGAEPPDPPEAA